MSEEKLSMPICETCKKGERNQIALIVALLNESNRHESKIQELKCGPESLFLAWLAEWYPELYKEFNKVLSGKKKWEDMPKYELT